MIKRSKILPYANDINLFSHINSISSCQSLQSDLNLLVRRDYSNGLRLRNIIDFDFHIDSNPLENISSFKDRGILFDNQLRFNSQIVSIVNKSTRTLVYIKQYAKEFNYPFTTKSFYLSLVRPILEYGSVVWNPLYHVHSDKIESVQKQFLLFALRPPFPDPLERLPSYSLRLTLIRL